MAAVGGGRAGAVGLALALMAAGGAAGQGLVDQVTGDAWDVEAVAAGPRPTDPFLGALFEGYLERARAERALFDWPDTAELVTRLRAVAAGAAPAPFDLGDYDLEADQVATLAPAGAELAALLANPGARLRAPAALGRAQVAHDCWVEQMEEGWQTADIARCAGHFAEATAEVRAAAQLPQTFVVVLPEPDGEIGGIVLGGTLLNQPNQGAGADGRALPLAPEEVDATFGAALGARPLPAREFTLTFDYNETALTPAGAALVAEIVADLGRRAAAEVIVTGHADAPGDPAINRRLSRARAARVRDAIAAAAPPGVALRFRLAARGESALIVPTALAEERNRRVGVLIR